MTISELKSEGYTHSTKRFIDRTKEGLNYIKEIEGFWKFLENKGGGNYGMNDTYSFTKRGFDFYEIGVYGDGSIQMYRR